MDKQGATPGAQWQAYLQQARIRDCLVRLARGEDRRDAALIRASYWPDATSDYGVFAGDFDAYLAWVVPGSSAIPATQHLLGQSYFEFDSAFDGDFDGRSAGEPGSESDGARDGSVAKVETQVWSYHRVDFGSEHRDTAIGGRYLDRFEQRGGEWRIAQRTMLYDWYQDFGVAIDWSQGVMGLPFSAPHYAGRAHGDFSEVFFAARKGS